MNLVIHESITTKIAALQQRPSHAMLLSGKPGVGLKTLAYELAAPSTDIVVIEPELLTKASTVARIGVERVRELYTQTRTHAGSHERVIIIDDSDTMTHGAQNAFLKLLEEPNQSTRFVLTSHHPETLLPTIRSRVQSLYIPPISTAQTTELLETLPKVPAAVRPQLLFIAQGLPAELTRLANDQAYRNESIARISFAKQLLESSRYDRTIQLQTEKFNRASALALLGAMIQLLSITPNPDSNAPIERMLSAYERIEQGGNTKLQLLSAVL